MRLFSYFVIFGSSQAQQKCVVCTAKRDHMGVITDGNEDCFKNGADLEQTCNISGGVGGELWCYNDIEVSWMPRGEQEILVRRGCRNNNWKNECEDGENGGYKFRDCHNVCDATANESCNKNTVEDAIAKINEDGNPNLACHSCLTDESSDSAAQAKCQNEPEISQKCPNYANKACFNSQSTTIKPQAGEPNEYGYYKGCSSFSLENTECDPFVNGLFGEATNCKKTCSGDNCNTGPVTAPAQCYVCDYTWDDFGMVGQGNPNCWNTTSLTAGELSSCPDESPYCMTELAAEWMSRGNQMHRISRYCSQTASVVPACFEQSSNDNYNLLYKDCKSSCKGDANDGGALGCNNDNQDVYDLFAAQDPVNSCISCHYSDKDANDGIKLCVNGTITDKKTCATYENSGCYSASNWEKLNDVDMEETFRGCSSFSENMIQNICSDEILNIQDHKYTICKNWCKTNQCNTVQLVKPDGTGSAAIFKYSIFSVLLVLML